MATMNVVQMAADMGRLRREAGREARREPGRKTLAPP
jgi:hypothetical protein